MKFQFTKDFLSQIKRIKDISLKEKIKNVVKVVSLCEKIWDIPNLKKLKGYKTAYRIKIGDYRIGIFFEDGVILFSRIEHRKDIYKNFP
jgi:mRNA interferase RelE/StbE